MLGPRSLHLKVLCGTQHKNLINSHCQEDVISKDAVATAFSHATGLAASNFSVEIKLISGTRESDNSKDLRDLLILLHLIK